MHDVTILDDVVFALDSEFSGLADSSFGAIQDIVVVLDDL